MNEQTLEVVKETRYLLRSRLNPRQDFPREEIDGLAVSMREKGCMLPLLGRAVVGPALMEDQGKNGIVVRAFAHVGGVMKKVSAVIAEGLREEEAEVLCGLIDSGECVEICDGARRVVAAQACSVEWEGGVRELGAMEELPVIVRAMSDGEMLEVMMTSSLQREDLNELEESDGFARLLALRDSGGKAVYSGETMARRLGVSHQYVQQRVSLQRLTGEARGAFLEGRLLFSVARELVRLPGGMFEVVLEICLHPRKWPLVARVGDSKRDDGLCLAEFEQLVEHFSRPLTGVAFDLADAALVPSVGACVGCAYNPPKPAGRRGGFVPRCINPACFDKKVEVFSLSELVKAEQSGATILKGLDRSEAVHGGPNHGIGLDYVDLDSEMDPGDRGVDVAEGTKWGDVVAKDGVVQARVYVAVDDRGRVRRLAKRGEAVAAVRVLDRSAKVNVSRGGGKSLQDEELAAQLKAEEKGRELERKVRLETAREVMVGVVAEVENRFTTDSDFAGALLLVGVRHAGKSGAVWVCRRRGIEPGTDAVVAITKYAEGLSPRGVKGLFVELLLAMDFCGAENPNVGAVVADCARPVLKAYGVNAKAVEKKVRASLQHPTSNIEHPTSKDCTQATGGGSSSCSSSSSNE